MSQTKNYQAQAIKKDKSHGREVERKVRIWDKEEYLSKTIVSKFKDVKSLIKIERKGVRGKKKYEQIVYYISSKKTTAEEFLEKIQGHWKIENQLHWGGMDGEPASPC